jgi:hypothetical protein
VPSGSHVGTGHRSAPASPDAASSSGELGIRPQGISEGVAGLYRTGAESRITWWWWLVPGVAGTAAAAIIAAAGIR